MKERPILFSAHEVCATLDGRQTQVRRIVKHPIPSNIKSVVPYSNKQGNLVYGWSWGVSEKLGAITELVNMKCPYGKPGDRLWVRETFARIDDESGFGSGYTEYKATCANPEKVIWKPSIHMPRWASRISLEITGIRVERLQDISECDAKAEGSYVCDYFGRRLLDQSSNQGCYKWGYRSIWESLNGKGSWDLNPFVWVVEFERIKP